MSSRARLRRSDGDRHPERRSPFAGLLGEPDHRREPVRPIGHGSGNGVLQCCGDQSGYLQHAERAVGGLHRWWVDPSPDTSDSGNTTGTLTVNPTSASESGRGYRAVFTNEFGAANSTAATLTMNAPPPGCSANPMIAANPSDQLVTAPAPVSFNAAATNPANCSTLSVQWEV